jgi:hypothetical protein
MNASPASCLRLVEFKVRKTVARLELVVNALCWEIYCLLLGFICAICRKGCRRKIFITLINTMIMNTNIGRNFFSFLCTFRVLLSVHHNAAFLLNRNNIVLKEERFFVIKIESVDYI